MIVGIPQPLPVNKILTALADSPTVAGSKELTIPLDCEGVLVSLFVSVISGTFNLDVYTDTEPGKTKAVQSFPTIGAPTSELVIKKVATVLGNLRLVATYTGACTYEIRVKGLSSGETSVKVIGASTWQTGQFTATTTPQLMIPSSINDRQGIAIKNWSTSTQVYLAESAAACQPSTAWPLAGRDGFTLDVTAGAEVWVRTASGTADIRLATAGE